MHDYITNPFLCADRCNLVSVEQTIPLVNNRIQISVKACRNTAKQILVQAFEQYRLAFKFEIVPLNPFFVATDSSFLVRLAIDPHSVDSEEIGDLDSFALTNESCIAGLVSIM